jgi:hypothetical protein
LVSPEAILHGGRQRIFVAIQVRRESGPRDLFGRTAVCGRRLHALLKADQLMALRVLTWNFLPISLLFC